MNQFVKPLLIFAYVSTSLALIAYPWRDNLLYGPDYDATTTKLFVDTLFHKNIVVTPLHSSCSPDVKFEMMHFRIDDANWKRLVEQDDLQPFGKGTAPYALYDQEKDPLTRRFGRLFESMKQNSDWVVYMPKNVDPATEVSGPVLYSSAKREALMIWVYPD